MIRNTPANQDQYDWGKKEKKRKINKVLEWSISTVTGGCVSTVPSLKDSLFELQGYSEIAWKDFFF